MTSVTVSAQMMPARPNQRLPSSTIGMNRTPCAIDITIAGSARPVAWNSEVSRPVKPLAIIATSCAVRIVTPIASTERSADEGREHLLAEQEHRDREDQPRCRRP